MIYFGATLAPAVFFFFSIRGAHTLMHTSAKVFQSQVQPADQLDVQQLGHGASGLNGFILGCVSDFVFVSVGDFSTWACSRCVLCGMTFQLFGERIAVGVKYYLWVDLADDLRFLRIVCITLIYIIRL